MRPPFPLPRAAHRLALIVLAVILVGCEIPKAESPTGPPTSEPATVATAVPEEPPPTADPRTEPTEAARTPTPTASPAATSTPGRAPASTPPPSPTSTPTSSPTPPPTLSATQAASIEGRDWPSANGGLRNTRARDSAITSETVQELAPAWTFPFAGSGPYGAAAGAPVVVDGTVYAQDLGSMLYALDLGTGALRWRFDGGPPTAGPVGPTVADGRVFVAAGGGSMHALDAATGAPIWSVQLEKDGFQPLAVGDTVFIGTGNQAHVGGHSGMVHALDAATGETQWSFQVVEEGFWGNPQLNSGGGVWYPPAVDLEAGLAYFGTGNAGPYPGTVAFPNGTSRPGPNLYTSSMVALDLEDGSLDWYHQVVPHGLFDHDFQVSPILVDAVVEGERRELLIGAGKVGRVLALDRETHEVVWDTEVGVHENDDLRAVPPGETVKVFPGIFGGVETPMSVAGGRVFVPIVNLGTLHTATGHGATDGSGALLNASQSTNLAEGTGELVALDMATGELLWRQELDSPIFAGATAVGDLIFTATYSGVIVAYRQDTGHEVWRYDTGGGINAWPAVQGDTILWPVGLGPEPRLIAFRLGGGAP